MKVKHKVNSTLMKLSETFFAQTLHSGMLRDTKYPSKIEVKLTSNSL